MHFKQAKLGNYIFIFILTAILTVNEEKNVCEEYPTSHISGGSHMYIFS